MIIFLFFSFFTINFVNLKYKNLYFLSVKNLNPPQIQQNSRLESNPPASVTTLVGSKGGLETNTKQRE